MHARIANKPLSRFVGHSNNDFSLATPQSSLIHPCRLTPPSMTFPGEYPSSRPAQHGQNHPEDDWESFDSDSPRHLASRGSNMPSTPVRAGYSANSNASVYSLRQPRRQGPRRRIDARPVTPRRSRPASRPPERNAAVLGTSLSYLLAPLRLVLYPIQIICFPFFTYLINLFILAAIATLAGYVIIPRFPGWITGLLSNMLSYVFKSSYFDIGELGDLSKDVMGFSARALATPSCTLTGLFCAHSLFTTSRSTATEEAPDTIGKTARPFWKWLTPQPKEEVDIGLVAQGLTKRVKWARNIFDSVKLLGEEHVIDPLDPVR